MMHNKPKKNNFLYAKLTSEKKTKKANKSKKIKTNITQHVLFGKKNFSWIFIKSREILFVFKGDTFLYNFGKSYKKNFIDPIK